MVEVAETPLALYGIVICVPGCWVRGRTRLSEDCRPSHYKIKPYQEDKDFTAVSAGTLGVLGTAFGVREQECRFVGCFFSLPCSMFSCTWTGSDHKRSAFQLLHQRLVNAMQYA